MAILYSELERAGLKIDWTLYDRLNHPIWIGDEPGRDMFFTLRFVASGKEFFDFNEKKKRKIDTYYANDFYELYKKSKEIARANSYTGLKRGKEINITKEFWPHLWREYRKTKQRRFVLPAFIRNKITSKEAWKRAVRSLANKHKEYRYLKVIQPAVGWAKYLQLNEDEVFSYLASLLGKEKEKDIQ
ncbi:MAG: hypothetical protein ABDI07_11545, partial [Candidatus Kryptonium sp.]